MDILDSPHEDLDQNLLDEINEELKTKIFRFSLSIHIRKQCYFLKCQERKNQEFIYPLSFEEKYRFETGMALFSFLLQHDNLNDCENLQEFLILLRDHIDSAIQYLAETEYDPTITDLNKQLQNKRIPEIINFPGTSYHE